VKVRLDGIDAPEQKQAYGTRAKQFMSDLVFGKNVEVLEKGPDRYGRTIGHIFVGGQDVSEAMVRAGFAWRYVEYAKDDHRLELGLWSDLKAVPPWDFRKQKK
jgi:micrococcal nuclease